MFVGQAFWNSENFCAADSGIKQTGVANSYIITFKLPSCDSFHIHVYILVSAKTSPTPDDFTHRGRASGWERVIVNQV